MADQNFTTEELESEEWRSVIGRYQGIYSVSNLGRVRRDKGGPGCRAGRIMQPRIVKGYLLAQLSDNGFDTGIAVHRLVAGAFRGACPEGYQVNHKDGCKINNREYNLEYVTAQENAAHAVKMGLYRRGETHPWATSPALIPRGERSGAKLNEMQVRVIRRLVPLMAQHEIARLFNITSENVYCIKKGLTWKHI